MLFENFPLDYHRPQISTVESAEFHSTTDWSDVSTWQSICSWLFVDNLRTKRFHRRSATLSAHSSSVQRSFIPTGQWHVGNVWRHRFASWAQVVEESFIKLMPHSSKWATSPSNQVLPNLHPWHWRRDGLFRLLSNMLIDKCVHIHTGMCIQQIDGYEHEMRSNGCVIIDNGFGGVYRKTRRHW